MTRIGVARRERLVKLMIYTFPAGNDLIFQSNASLSGAYEVEPMDVRI